MHGGKHGSNGSQRMSKPGERNPVQPGAHCCRVGGDDRQKPRLRSGGRVRMGLPQPAVGDSRRRSAVAEVGIAQAKLSLRLHPLISPKST